MKDIKYYLDLPYTTILRRDEEGDVVARVAELPGCTAHGKDNAEALANLNESMNVWITDCIEAGDPVPEPRTEESLPSGKWLQRVPKTLHRKLIRAAESEQTSLNQLVTSIIAEAIGWREQANNRHRSDFQGPAPVAISCYPKMSGGYLYPTVSRFYGGGFSEPYSLNLLNLGPGSWNIEHSAAEREGDVSNVPVMAEALLGSGGKTNIVWTEPANYAFKKEAKHSRARR